MAEKTNDRLRYENAWHLDMRFSIGIVLAILLQCGSFIWYGSKIDSRVEETSMQVTVLNQWKDKQEDDRAKNEAHFATVDEKLSEQTDILRRIDDRLERLNLSKVR